MKNDVCKNQIFFTGQWLNIVWGGVKEYLQTTVCVRSMSVTALLQLLNMTWIVDWYGWDFHRVQRPESTESQSISSGCRFLQVHYVILFTYLFFSLYHFRVFYCVIVYTNNNQSYKKQKKKKKKKKKKKNMRKIYLYAKENTCIKKHLSCFFHGTAKIEHVCTLWYFMQTGAFYKWY